MNGDWFPGDNTPEEDAAMLAGQAAYGGRAAEREARAAEWVRAHAAEQVELAGLVRAERDPARAERAAEWVRAHAAELVERAGRARAERARAARARSRGGTP